MAKSASNSTCILYLILLKNKVESIIRTISFLCRFLSVEYRLDWAPVLSARMRTGTCFSDPVVSLDSLWIAVTYRSLANQNTVVFYLLCPSTCVHSHGFEKGLCIGPLEGVLMFTTKKSRIPAESAVSVRVSVTTFTTIFSSFI